MTAQLLPPGMSTADFAGVLGAMSAAVGSRWVSSDEQPLFGYRDPNATLDDDAFLPSAVIAPADVEEVRAVLRIANAHGLCLWPVASICGGSLPGCTASGVLRPADAGVRRCAGDA